MAVGMRSARLFYLAGDAGGGGANYIAAEGEQADDDLAVTFRQRPVDVPTH